MKLVFASIGYERSPNDIKVLCVAIERGMLTQVLPVSTQGMLAQLYFFSHFMVVYVIYDKFNKLLDSFRYRSTKNIFNHRHVQLKNVVKKAFDVLKNIFKILKIRHTCKFKKQCLIVLACFILHNLHITSYK